MEGSQAPVEMAPGTEPADAPSAPAEQTPDAQQQASAPDYAALQQQLTDLAPSLDSLRTTLEGARSEQLQEQQQPGEPEPEVGPPDLGFMSPEQADYDPDAAAQLLGQVIDKNVQERLQAVTSPLQEQIADMRLDREAEHLAQEFPELEGNNEAVERAFADAEAYAKQIEQPQLAGSVPFVRLVYMAGRAAEAAREEAQPDVRTATLLGAGGAGPAGASSGGSVEDALLAGARRNPLPFG